MTAVRSLRTFVATVVLALPATAALADGNDDPVAARAACEKLKQADTPEKLKQCCDDQILVGSSAEQAKLVAQCIQGSGKKTANPPAAPGKTSRRK